MASVAQSRAQFFWKCINPIIKIAVGVFGFLSALTWFRDELLPKEYGQHLLDFLPHWPLYLWVAMRLAIVATAIGEGRYQQFRMQYAQETSKALINAAGEEFRQLPKRSQLNAIGVPVGIAIVFLFLWRFPPSWHAKMESTPGDRQAQSSAMPHIAMTPSLQMEGSNPTVMVMFHNRGREDVENPTLTIILDIDGKELGEGKRDLPILRSDINRKLFVIFPQQQIYDDVMDGKKNLKVKVTSPL